MAALGQSLIALLRNFHWRKLSIMHDLANARVREAVRIVSVSLAVQAAQFDVTTTPFTSTGADQADRATYYNALIACAKHSRSMPNY